jgi:hypothetical protein
MFETGIGEQSTCNFANGVAYITRVVSRTLVTTGSAARHTLSRVSLFQ